MAVLAFLLLAWTANTAGAAGRQTVGNGHLEEITSKLTVLDHLAGTNRLRLAIELPLRNQPALQGLLDQLYDPASPLFHHWLEPAEFTERFGPSQADYESLAAWARANGLSVAATYGNRVLLDVEGAAADIERALQVNLLVYQHPTEPRTFFAPDVAPSLDVGVPVLQISGLDNYSLPQPRIKDRPASPIAPNQSPVTEQDQASPRAGSGPAGTYAGNDFRAAYAPAATMTGLGQSVGLLQFDGYTSNDIAYYVATNHLTSISISNVLLDGYSGIPTGNGGEVEVSLDIEMVLSMAPGLSKIYVYEAGPSGLWHDILNRMANDNVAKQLSCSWYIPGGAMDTNADQIFQQMAAQGQSFFSASGDYDAFCGLIPFPGDTPYITEVGGTLLHTAGPGGAYTSEWAWNRTNGIGSGGGISTQYPIPAWQKGVSMGANFGSTIMRNVPDVALTADDVYVRADALDQNVGGTSCAAPLWAGFCALINQQAIANARPTVGFINPAIYNIATNGPGALYLYASCFHDIIIGNNTNTGCGPNRFPAVIGYDLATGLGSPTTPLIYALGGPLDALQISPASGFSAVGGAGGPFTVTSESLVLTNTGTNSLSWSLSNTSSWLSVSSSSGSLSTNSATAVTVSLNAAASNLVVGTYSASLWFTNLSDGFGQARLFTLSIIAPPTIVLQPTNQTLMDGATATFAAGISSNSGQPLFFQWQLNGTNLSDGGKISGSSTTNLTIAGVSPANAGSYDLVVSNAAGIAISSNAFLLTIAGNVDHFGWGPIASPQAFTIPFPVSLTAYDVANVVATNFNGTVGFNQSGGGGSNLVIQTSASISNSVGSILTSLGYNYDFANTSLFSSLNLSNYSTIILGMDGGTPTYADMAYLASFVNAGARLIAIGGSSWLSFAQGLNDMFVHINTNSYGWNTVTGTPNFSVTMPGHPLATGLPSTYNFSNLSATYYMARVSDSAATTIANNGDGYPCLLTKPVGSGNLVMFINSANDIYWGNSADSNVLRTVLANAMHWGPAGGSSGIAVSPTNSGSFTNGVWGGNLRVLQTATNVILSANDGAGHSGLSNPFDVVYSNTPPFIALQPTNQTIPSGYNATFTVSAAGSPPLSYSWQLNGTPMPGATNASFTTNNVAVSVSGSQFQCVVTNPYGSTNSQIATLTVQAAPPVITQQPTNEVVIVGGNATFGVNAFGSLPLNYFWLRNGNFIAGATNSTYSTNDVQLSDTGAQFSCLVSNTYGVLTSSNAQLTVLNVPTDWFTELFAANITNLAFESFTFTPNASANFYSACTAPAVSLPTDPTGGTVLAEGDDTYVQITLSGSNTVAIYNNRTNVLFIGSNGYLTMNAGDTSLTPTYAQHFLLPRVSPLFRDLNPSAGGSVSWKQLADRVAVSYLAVPIYGNNAATNTFQVELFFNGQIRITYLSLNTPTGLAGLSAGAGQPTNFVASDFTSYAPCVPEPPSLALQPTNETVPAGGTASFSVLANGTPPLSYFWQRNGALIAGATAAVYATNNVQLPDSGAAFSCIVSNAYGLTNSLAAVLTVLPSPPSIVTQPVSVFKSAGSTATFTVSASGSSPLGYFWQRNGTFIAGATNSSYATNNVEVSDSGSQFSCLVTNAYGATNSLPATLTVYNPSSLRFAIFGAPSSPAWNTDVQSKIQSAAAPGVTVDAFLASGTNPTPTLAQLQHYSAVLVYSDTSFSDNVGLGNVLADYLDAGGGVVLSTFAYLSSGGNGIQGRLLTNGYLPFTTGSQTSGSDMTMVADQPTNAILAGVSSFDGGTSSYHNSPINTTTGAVLVAHWTDAQPLVATKQITGRMVGLNFYPPSSDARTDFWKTNTGGALLMANALTWVSGPIPPPKLQLVPVGLNSCAFTFVLNGPAGTTFNLQSASDLRHWTTMFSSTIPAGGSVTIIDPYACTPASRFYRASVVAGAHVSALQASSVAGPGNVIILPPPQ